MAYMAGLHFWWPKFTGRMYPKTFSQVAAVVTFIGFNLTFLTAVHPEFQTLNILSTAGASVLEVGYLPPILYFAWSLHSGKIAGPNPWARMADSIPAFGEELHIDSDYHSRCV